MLSREQVRDRTVAARTIRGFHQFALQDLFYEEGKGAFKRQELGKIERQEAPLTEYGRQVLARLLRVPEWWFTSEDPFAAMLNGDAEENPLRARVDELAGELRDLREQVSRLEPLAQVERDEVRTLPRRGRSAPKSAGAKRGSRKSGGA